VAVKVDSQVHQQQVAQQILAAVLAAVTHFQVAVMSAAAQELLL
jgi:hypothetical protein